MSLYDNDNFLACRDCGVLQPEIGYSAGWTDGAVEDAVDAYDEFLASHRAHRTARFRRHGAETHADRPLWDPMARIAFEVSDGGDPYTVRSERQAIDQPRVYHFTRGALPPTSVQTTIDAAELCRGLDLAFHPHALRPSKAERLITVMQDLVSQIAPEDVEVAFDVADDPACSIARMPDATYTALHDRCAEIFEPWELSRVQAFLRDNRDVDGLLALRVRRGANALPT
jgi:hypothetical protein